MKKAFTLIELLVVIAIISIIVSLTIVSLGSVRSKTRDTKRVSDIRQLQSALDTYYNDNNSYPSVITTGNAIVGPNNITYMDSIPSAPGTPDGSCTTDTYAYSLVDANTYNIVYCLGNAVQNVGAGRLAAVPGNIAGTPPPVAGDSYQGGIVAYIFQAGDTGYVAGQTHGLIAATSDQSTAAQWGCYGTEITGADGTAIGTGNQNTIDIMAGCATAGIAARLCGDLVLNGYSDWYLPSKDELNKLYINRTAIGGFATGFGYLSSSESQIFTTTGALDQNFGGGGQDVVDKNGSYRVRAVRSF